MQQKRIVVVGGGPAGMMAAIRASELQQEVILIERNPSLGRKLLLSGKGRCNITNLCDVNSFLERFSKNGLFLRDAFKKFFNRELISFFEERGLKLKAERQLRVFPVTDSSASILKVLADELSKNKVEILFRSRVKDVLVESSNVKGAVLESGEKIPADRIILATGGVSYAFTGSSGEGLKIAKKLGHSITDLRPGLVPLVTKEKYPKELEGLALKNIRLKFSCGKEKIISNIGELMFTGSGISGPLVLTLSGRIVDWLNKGELTFVEIDLKPGLSAEQLDSRLLREFKLHSGKNLKNVLKNLLPMKLVDVFARLANMDARKSVSLVTKEERRALVALLKGLRLEIIRPLPMEEAMVTRGGVSLKEINPRSMESRIIKGLYFAGEMIDIDADTGGFNLQSAFSTGWLAGEAAAIN